MAMRRSLGPSCVLSLLSTLFSPCYPAFIIRSKDNNQWATGVARYEPLRRFVVVSTVFGNENKVDASDGLIGTECELLIADPTGHWVEIQVDSPQMCVGGALVAQDNGGHAIVVGLEGNQTRLLNLYAIGSDNPTLGATHDILQGKIPVTLDFGNIDDDYVYVAMHDMGDDAVPTGFGADRASNLIGVMSFWDKFTNPVLLAQDTSNRHVPYIIKLNPTSGEVGWLGLYEVQNGSATISAIAYSEFSLIVCGSTNGSGDLVGYDNDGDWDGFVAFINPVTGNLDFPFVDPDTGDAEDRAYIRIQSSEEGKNDYVHAMCLIGADILYVVGTTDGDSSGGVAFLLKIDIQRRVIVKRQQISGSNKSGLKVVCSDTHVYVGGHIASSKTTSPEQQQNVYVVSYDGALTEIQWSVEIDTTSYFGETRRDEIVELEMNPAGDINVLLNSQVLSTGVSDIVFLDLQVDTGANEIQKGAKAGNVGGIPSTGLEGVEPDGAVDDQDDVITDTDVENQQKLVIALSVTIPISLALSIGFFTFMSHRKKKNKTTNVKVEASTPDVDNTNRPIV